MRARANYMTLETRREIAAADKRAKAGTIAGTNHPRGQLRAIQWARWKAGTAADPYPAGVLSAGCEAVIFRVYHDARIPEMRISLPEHCRPVADVDRGY